MTPFYALLQFSVFAIRCATSVRLRLATHPGILSTSFACPPIRRRREPRILKMADVFRRLRVDELKKYLQDRGVLCVGKRKGELVLLAEKAGRVYEEKGECDHEESLRKRRRIEGENGAVVDLNSATVTWTDNLSKLPVITLGEVFKYLLKQCSWSAERMANYREDDGFLMFKDQHIEHVKYGRRVFS